MKRCPACGTLVAEERSTCSICGSELQNVEEEPFSVSVQEEEKSEAAGESVVQQKKVSATRKMIFIRVTIGAVGCALLIAAVILNGTPPVFYNSRFGANVSVISTALLGLGMICISVATRWWQNP